MEWDELREEMEKGSLFHGFEEGNISFLPTFKVLKGVNGSAYSQNRFAFYVLFFSNFTLYVYSLG